MPIDTHIRLNYYRKPIEDLGKEEISRSWLSAAVLMYKAQRERERKREKEGERERERERERLRRMLIYSRQSSYTY